LANNGESKRTVPIEVTSVEGYTVYWKFQDRHEIKLGSFVMDEDTKLPPEFSKHPEGKWVFIYCDEHKIIYDIDSLVHIVRD